MLCLMLMVSWSPTPSDRFYSTRHTRGELSVHAWLQFRTMRLKTHSLFTYPTILFALLSWVCLSGEAGVSLQLLFSMRYSAAGKCIAQAAASWCHNVGLCSKVLIVLLRGQAEIFSPSHQFAQLPLQTVVKQEWVCIWVWGCDSSTFSRIGGPYFCAIYNLRKGISALSPPGTEIKISTE